MWFIKEWLEADAKKHTPEWGDKCITNIRFNKKPLVNKAVAVEAMSYLLSCQDTTNLRNLFLNSMYGGANKKTIYDSNQRPIVERDIIGECKNGMEDVDFTPLPILEKTKNILIAEMKKMGFNVDIRSTDPSSALSKKRDKALIEKQKQIEYDLSKLYTSIGQKPVENKEHEQRFGVKLGHGNVSDFAAMSLNAEDPDDVNLFMEHFHKLDWEIKAQKVTDAVFDFNRIEDKIDLFTTDLIAKKACCAHQYVSPINGQMIQEYIDPTTVFIFGGGRRKDYNDASAKVIEINVSVKEMLNRFGDSFDFKIHMDKLITAIRYNSQVEVTGIHADDRLLWGNGAMNQKGVYSYNDFMQLNVRIGYVEYFTQDQEDYNEDLTGKIQKSDESFQNNQPIDGEEYAAHSRFETPMYKSWYLAITEFDQVLFNFGKMPYCNIEGYDDVTNSFSIITWKEVGKSLATMAIPIVDLIIECWYKFRHEVRKAKPSGRGWNIDSILEMSLDIFDGAEMDTKSKVQAMMQLLDQSSNELYKYPSPDGKQIPIQVISKVISCLMA